MNFKPLLKRLPALFSCIFLLSVYATAQTAAGIEYNKRDHTPKVITFGTETAPGMENVQQVLGRYFSPTSPANKLELTRSTRTKNGTVVQGYAQWYRGYKVEHGVVTVTAYNNRISFINANFYRPPVAPAASVQLNEHAALQHALASVGADRYMWEVPGAEKMIQRHYHRADTSYFPHASLVWIEDRTGAAPDGILHLCYRFDIYAAKPLSRQVVYVDAQTGRVLFSNQILKNVQGSGNSLYSGNVSFQTELAGSQYQLHDLTRGNGIYTYTMSNSTVSQSEVSSSGTNWTTDPTALDAHWAFKKIYDYWDSVHARPSYDGLNAEIDGYVHYDQGFDNAFWDGSEMIFGDGSGVANGGFSPLVSLDVCAHELGHAICQTTCDLVYQQESGAMNEGFSDIWGATIESWADPHEVDAQPKQTWNMGEEIGGGTPMRSMSNPKLFNDPNTYGGQYWVYAGAGCNFTDDECGVHTNSGVLNYWYYLLAHGGSGTNDSAHAYSVTGIGISKAANIVYNTELALINTSVYADCRTTSINVAGMLYGSCSAEAEAVTRAWYAVGVGNNFVPCTPQVAFTADSTFVSEKVAGNACPATKKIYVPLQVGGVPSAGGTATVTVTAAPSAGMVNGVNYTLDSAAFFIPAGFMGTRNVVITLYDNGAVNSNYRYIDLQFTITPNGSNLGSGSPTHNRVVIRDDEKIPANTSAAQVTVGIAGASGNYTTPFTNYDVETRLQYLYRPAELIAAGVLPNAPITSIAYNVLTKMTTQAFSGFQVRIANVPANAGFGAGNMLNPAFTQVYNGSYTTTLGWNTIPFSNTFSWNGTGCLLVNICYNNTGSQATSGNYDNVAEASPIIADTLFALDAEAAGSGGGCNLQSIAYATQAKPVTRIVQTIPATTVATALNAARTWDVHNGENIYFYTATDSTLIANVKNPDHDLGCTSATVSKAGNGMAPTSIGAAAFSANRSVKEISIIPSQNASNTNYSAAMYLTAAELGSVTPGTLYLMKTDASTDAGINALNSQIVTPAVQSFGSFYGFSGSFTGFSRYFLVDRWVPLGVESVTGGNYINVVNTIFDNRIDIVYHVAQSSNVAVQLYDITGRVCYAGNSALTAGSGKVQIDVSGAALVTGNYILKITGQEGCYVQKLFRK